MGSSGGTGEALRHGLLHRSQHAGQRRVGSDQRWKKNKNNKQTQRKGKKRKEKERKIRYDFSNDPPVLKPINACSDQGPCPRAHWEGKGCVTESSFCCWRWGVWGL